MSVTVVEQTTRRSLTAVKDQVQGVNELLFSLHVSYDIGYVR